MTRDTFAGATFDLVTEECRDAVWEASPEEFGASYLEGTTPDCLNEADLRDWLRERPAKKPMYADPTKLEATDGMSPRHALPRPDRRPDRRARRLSARADLRGPD